MACIVYSTGDIDKSIAARVECKIDEYTSQGKVYAPGVKLMSRRSRGWQSAYKSDRQRFGKARAGHYTTKLG